MSVIPFVAVLAVFVFFGSGRPDAESKSVNAGESFQTVAQSHHKQTDDQEPKAGAVNYAKTYQSDISAEQTKDGMKMAPDIQKDRTPAQSLSNAEQKQKDQQTIYSYIRDKYTKIKEEDARKISAHLVEYGEHYDMDPKLAAAVIERESGFNKNAVSATGAKGLGQIKDFNFKQLDIKNPFDIKQNVKGTTAYLKEMIGKWKGKSENEVELGLASYFRGYGSISRNDRAMEDQKTSQYVQDILNNYQEIILRSKE